MNVRSTNYFCVQAWMVTELGLQGVERDVYAVIYGYCQDEESDYHGSIEYMAALTGHSRTAVWKAFQGLLKKGLVKKESYTINGVKVCRYRTYVPAEHSMFLSNIAKPENSIAPVYLSNTNNKQKDKKKENKEDNKKEIQEFVDLYHNICNTLPTIRSITDKREKAIRKILNKFTKEEINTVFTNANNSDFLTGKNDRGWKADLDFILREDKFINILEGKYGGKRRSTNVSAEGHLELNRNADKNKMKEAMERGEATKF